MDWAQIIGTVLTGVVTTTVLMISKKGANKQQERTEDGTYYLRQNKMNYYFGIVWVVLLIAIALGVLFFGPKDSYLLIIVLLLLVSLFGVFMIVFYENCWLEFDEQTITLGTLTGKTKSMEWKEIEKVSYGKMSGYIKVKSTTELLKISSQMVGLIEFLKMMEQQTKFKQKDLKIPY